MKIANYKNHEKCLITQKTKNKTFAAIFLPHSLKYENHKTLLANQKITVIDQTKTMEKNWNLDKIPFNNIAELHGILKVLIWFIKIFQYTQDFLNQEIWIFSNGENVFKFIKNVHCTGTACDIKKTIKFLINKRFIFNFQWTSEHMDISGHEKTDTMAQLRQLLWEKKELFIFLM